METEKVAKAILQKNELLLKCGTMTKQVGKMGKMKWIFAILMAIWLLCAWSIATDPDVTPLPTPTEVTTPSISILSTEPETTALLSVEGAILVDNCMLITSPGYYLLNQSIWNSNAIVCIEIMEDNVIFDGEGHTIDGRDTLSTVGIRNWKASGHYNNITIKNVIVRDWSNGIQVKILHNGLIENCSVISNGVGIHLNTLSTDNFIIGNTIEDNTVAGIMFEDNTRSNTIYNNYINNINNTAFIYSGQNIWNITPIDGINIIGGTKIAGNYWADPVGYGFSELCPCQDNGICFDDYPLPNSGGINFDKEPLCYPPTGFSIVVFNNMEDWTLDAEDGLIHSYPNAGDIYITGYGTNGWQVTIDSNQPLGRMASSHGEILSLPLFIAENNTGDYHQVNSNEVIASSVTSNPHFSVDLKQQIQWSDPTGDYEIILKFTASTI